MQNTAEELTKLATVDVATVEDDSIIVQFATQTVSESMQSEMLSRGFAAASVDSSGDNAEVTYKNLTDF